MQTWTENLALCSWLHELCRLIARSGSPWNRPKRRCGSCEARNCLRRYCLCSRKSSWWVETEFQALRDEIPWIKFKRVRFHTYIGDIGLRASARAMLL
eukprot:s1858_g9.t1